MSKALTQLKELQARFKKTKKSESQPMWYIRESNHLRPLVEADFEDGKIDMDTYDKYIDEDDAIREGIGEW